MIRRGSISIVMILSLLCSPWSAPGVGAHGSSEPSPSNAPSHESRQETADEQGERQACRTKKDPISNGLWAGINLDISQLFSSKSTSRKCESSKPSHEATPSQKVHGNATAHAHNAAHTYAGLGDSIAAGQGLEPIGTCGRSAQSYPYVVAEKQGLSLIHAACSGATVGDLYTEQHISGINPPPQLDRAFAQGTPELITITAGANDVRWFDFLLKCYRSTCGTNEDEQAIESFQNLLQNKLQFALTDIARRSNNSPPKVVLTGYYSPTTTRCEAIRSQITNDELRWINRHVQELNQTLQKTSSQFRFVKFVPVNFSGHDLCSNAPWIQDLGGNAPLHPNEQGQKALARSVLRVL